MKSNKTKQLTLAFLIPFIIILISYIVAGIAPFGSRSLISMDAYGQYFPMLSEMKNGLSQWSFSGALGFNQFTQSAYYTNSPLWLLLHLVPNSLMTSAVDLIVALRFGLAGLAFALWLRKKHNTDNLGIVASASAYALSAYTISFINQFMWMDAVVLLPIVAIGLEILYEQKKPYLYIFSLALTLFTNFYIGYMVCVFSVLYFLYMCFREKTPWLERGKSLLKFSISSLLAGGLVAVVLLPTYLAISKAISSGLVFDGEFELYHTPLEMLAKFLPFSKISLEFQAPNVYSGFIVLILCVFYLFKKNNTTRNRVIFIVLAVFAYLSFNFNLLDFMWHGFHYPNQLPGRQSFIFIFAMVSLAYAVFKDIKLDNKMLANILVLVLIFELSANSIYTITTQTWKGNVARFTAHDQDMEYVTEKYQDESDEFTRMELLTAYLNPGQQYNFNGISYYSSTMSEETYNFFGKIGMEVYARNVSTKYIPSNILNTIFGVRYLVDIENDIANYGGSLYLNELEQLETVTVYENPYALPLAFLVDDAVLDLDMKDKTGPDLQADILDHMLGNTTLLDYSDENAFAVAVNKLSENTLNITSFTETDISGTIRTNMDGILYTSIPNDGGWSVYVNGEEAEVVNLFDYLCAIELPEGSYDIRFVYRTPGLEIGTLLTLMSIIGIAILFIFGKSQARAESDEEASRTAEQ